MKQPPPTAHYLRRWMLDVMQAKEWNAQEWAEKAETSPTNITRFIKGSDHIPSYATLVKLALVAGEPIPTPGVAPADMPKVRLPLLNSGQLSRSKPTDLPALVSKAKERVVADWHNPRAYAMRLETSEFSALGYERDDIIVIDPDLEPRHGKHVFCTAGQGYGPGRYEPPYLFCAVSQIQVNLEQVTVFGTIVQLIRRMA